MINLGVMIEKHGRKSRIFLRIFPETAMSVSESRSRYPGIFPDFGAGG